MAYTGCVSTKSKVLVNRLSQTRTRNIRSAFSYRILSIHYRTVQSMPLEALTDKLAQPRLQPCQIFFNFVHRLVAWLHLLDDWHMDVNDVYLHLWLLNLNIAHLNNIMQPSYPGTTFIREDWVTRQLINAYYLHAWWVSELSTWGYYMIPYVNFMSMFLEWNVRNLFFPAVHKSSCPEFLSIHWDRKSVV